MTPRAPCGFALALGLALLLALSSENASAGGLYRWVTSDGRVEIGPTPPRGVNAVPWNPGQPETAPAAATPAAPAATAPAATAPRETPSAAPPTARAPRPLGPAVRKSGARRGKASDECAKLSTAARELALQASDAEREVAQLEAKIEKLESSEVAYSHSTNCTGKDAYGRSADCSSSSFDRDAEIERSQQALARAQEKLDEADENARRADVPEKCR